MTRITVTALAKFLGLPHKTVYRRLSRAGLLDNPGHGGRARVTIEAAMRVYPLILRAMLEKLAQNEAKRNMKKNIAE